MRAVFRRALTVTAGAAGSLACARAAPVATTPAPAAVTSPGAASSAASAASAASDTTGVRTLPTTPSGLEQFVVAVPAPSDTVGTCGKVPGESFGEPSLRGITWT